MFEHIAILFSFIQQVKEYLVVLKNFDYSCALEYERAITSKSNDAR